MTELAPARPMRIAARLDRMVPWFLLLPALIIFIAFLAVPVGMLFVTSFYSWDPTQGIQPDLTLANYAKFLSDPFYLGILARTVRISLVVVLTTLVLGYPVAYVLTNTHGRTRGFLTIAVLSPLLISMVVRTYGWMILLGQGGPIDHALRAIGWENPPKLLFTELGIIIGLTHVLLPYMILSIAGSLERISPAVIRAAANLGADRLRIFLRVIFPLSLPGVFSGSVIVFSLSASAFVTPAMLGGPQAKVVSFLTYEQVAVLLNWPLGSAIAFILMLITAGLLVLYSRVLERSRYGVVFE